MNGETSTSYAARINARHHRLWKNRTPLLGSLDLELTERCNNDCIHCCINLPENDAAARQRELTTGQIKAVLTEAAALGALSVRFTGGEPLLREDFAELYLFARRQGLKVLLFTNGRLISPELVKLFKHILPLEKIEVSVYGMRRESYEAVSRVRGSFAEFRRGIDLLREAGIPFVAKGALLPPNRREMEEFEAWAATIPAMDRPPSYSMFFDLRGRRDSPAKNRLIQSLRVSPDDGVALLRRRGQAYFQEMRQFCGKFMGPAGDLLFSCGAGHGACVDAYGAVQPCLLLRDPDMAYNLQGGSLREALTDFFPRLRQTRATNADYLDRCARCFLKGLCEQCPAKSWAEHGTLDTPVDYLCQVAHAQALDLGLLREGERPWEVKNWKERIAWL
ncbi:MAG: radical SAM protein [Deltaproteobacteria bacterium]|nr:radical SAM protein [Deltaproteobacteria bacterium]